MRHVGKSRKQIVEELEKVYQGEYGEYMYFAGQVFVFKQGDFAIKTLRVRHGKPNLQKDLTLKYQSRSVYEGDSRDTLDMIIQQWKTEWNWYQYSYGNIPGIVVPEEKYGICDDPSGSSSLTVKVTMPWVSNILGDIFRLEAEQLFNYCNDHPGFRTSIISLMQKFISDAETSDLYPDFYGVDNIAVYLDHGIPKIALIDPHLIHIRSRTNGNHKKIFERVDHRFRTFLDDPKGLESYKQLTSDGLM